MQQKAFSEKSPTKRNIGVEQHSIDKLLNQFESSRIEGEEEEDLGPQQKLGTVTLKQKRRINSYGTEDEEQLGGTGAQMLEKERRKIQMMPRMTSDNKKPSFEKKEDAD